MEAADRVTESPKVNTEQQKTQAAAKDASSSLHAQKQNDCVDHFKYELIKEQWILTEF